jgi:hypothetical protein
MNGCHVVVRELRERSDVLRGGGEANQGAEGCWLEYVSESGRFTKDLPNLAVRQVGFTPNW